MHISVIRCLHCTLKLSNISWFYQNVLLDENQIKWHIFTKFLELNLVLQIFFQLEHSEWYSVAIWVFFRIRLVKITLNSNITYITSDL